MQFFLFEGNEISVKKMFIIQHGQILNYFIGFYPQTAMIMNSLFGLSTPTQNFQANIIDIYIAYISLIGKFG